VYKNQTNNSITMPRTDVAELKEKIKIALSLIMPTRSDKIGATVYLIPNASDVQKGAFMLQRVLHEFPFYMVGTKRQEQLKASRNRRKPK
jgi:hypothetical protein